MNDEKLIAILKKEIELSTGCTDPGSVCLAVSRAVHELGRIPQRIEVTVSPNIFKNGVSVGIPGTNRQGLDLAAAIGALVDASDEGLEILTHVNPAIVAEAENLLGKGDVHVRYADSPDPLFVKAHVSWGAENATTTIAGDYSRIIQVTKNGETVYTRPGNGVEPDDDILNDFSVAALYSTIESMDSDRLRFLVKYAHTNYEAVQKDLAEPRMALGRAMARREEGLSGNHLLAGRARTYTAAAGEARMRGLNVPIATVSGSGNHGITNFLGILAVADALGSTEDALAKALAISTMITVYIKGHIQRMTAFCGCAVAAATGVAAGTVYLLGGNYQQAVNAMQSVVGTLGGMFCDGAKESCAYKLSTAAAMAVQFASLALEGCHIPASAGIIGPTIEKTFSNLGKLNNPGMVETDKVLISLVEENISRREA